MATVKKNGNITVVKYNNLSRVDISIDDGKKNIELMDKDVRFLYNLLKEWLKG